MNAVARDRLEKAKRLIAAIEDDLRRAVALNAVFQRCALSKDVHKAFNNTYEANGLLVIHNALLCEFVMILMRICDRDSNSAGMPQLCGILEDKTVRQLLYENCKVRAGFGSRAPVTGRPIGDPGNADFYTQEYLDRDRNAIALADDTMRQLDRGISAFGKLRDSKTVASLKKLRDKTLAHKVTGKVDHGVKYLYPLQLLAKLLTIFDGMASSVDSVDHEFGELGRIWRNYATRFWRRAMYGPKRSS